MALRLAVGAWVDGHIDETGTVRCPQTCSHGFLQLWNGLAKVAALAKKLHHLFVAHIDAQTCGWAPENWEVATELMQ
jgi:hypothetical protein